MRVALHDQRLAAGQRLRISFHRTLRIPDDGRSYPLPPGLGVFPVASANDYEDRVPEEWRAENAFFIPMYQREALWIGFENEWPPVAIRVAVGNISAVSGRPVGDRLSADPQDYVVCPEQLWLDGVNAGPATVRQFVAMPLGEGYTVEGSITGREEHGGIQLAIFEPRPDVVLQRPAPQQGPTRARSPTPSKMGLGAGGRIGQKIYPDPHGVDVWDNASATTAVVHIVSSREYRQITGVEPPPTPIDASTYTAYGLPWFELYDERQGDVAAPEALIGAKTIAQRDHELGLGMQDEPVEIDEAQVTRLNPRGKHS